MPPPGTMLSRLPGPISNTMKPYRPVPGRHRLLFSPRAFHRARKRHPASGFLLSPRSPGTLEFTCPDIVHIRIIQQDPPEWRHCSSHSPCVKPHPPTRLSAIKKPQDPLPQKYMASFKHRQTGQDTDKKSLGGPSGEPSSAFFNNLGPTPLPACRFRKFRRSGKLRLSCWQPSPPSHPDRKTPVIRRPAWKPLAPAW